MMLSNMAVCLFANLANKESEAIFQLLRFVNIEWKMYNWLSKLKIQTLTAIFHYTLVIFH